MAQSESSRQLPERGGRPATAQHRRYITIHSSTTKKELRLSPLLLDGDLVLAVGVMDRYLFDRLFCRERGLDVKRRDHLSAALGRTDTDELELRRKDLDGQLFKCHAPAGGAVFTLGKHDDAPLVLIGTVCQARSVG